MCWNPRQYSHNWHTDAICAHLEAVTDGRRSSVPVDQRAARCDEILLVSVVFWNGVEQISEGQTFVTVIRPVTAFNDGLEF